MHGQKDTSTSELWDEGIVQPLLSFFCTRYPIFVDDRPVQDLTVTSWSASKVWFLPLRLCSSLQSITNCYGFLQVSMLLKLLLPLYISIITISILCAHNHMHFELSSWEKHEHPPAMPLFAKVTGFCTSTFLTRSKRKPK